MDKKISIFLLNFFSFQDFCHEGFFEELFEGCVRSYFTGLCEKPSEKFCARLSAQLYNWVLSMKANGDPPGLQKCGTWGLAQWWIWGVPRCDFDSKEGFESRDMSCRPISRSIYRFGRLHHFYLVHPKI